MGVEIDIFELCYVLWFFVVTFISKTASLRHVSNKVLRAKWQCFCQKLLFRLNFAIKTSIFKLRPLLRFLCLINSFYRRYVSSMYNRSNRSNRSNRLTRFNRSNSIDPINTSTLLFRKKCERHFCDWFLLTINRKHPCTYELFKISELSCSTSI